MLLMPLKVVLSFRHFLSRYYALVWCWWCQSVVVRISVKSGRVVRRFCLGRIKVMLSWCVVSTFSLRRMCLCVLSESSIVSTCCQCVLIGRVGSTPWEYMVTCLCMLPRSPLLILVVRTSAVNTCSREMSVRVLWSFAVSRCCQDALSGRAINTQCLGFRCQDRSPIEYSLKRLMLQLSTELLLPRIYKEQVLW